MGHYGPFLGCSPEACVYPANFKTSHLLQPSRAALAIAVLLFIWRPPMSLLKFRFNGVESVRNTTAHRPRTLAFLAALILVGFVVTGSFISVRSSAAARKRAAEQSDSSLKAKDDSGQ